MQLEKTRAEPCGEYFQKQIETEAEQFEKSDLTEEQERPICSPNVCSDSSQRSNKRKRDSSPTSGFRSHGEFGGAHSFGDAFKPQDGHFSLIKEF